jgi:hypothetical protein
MVIQFGAIPYYLTPFSGNPGARRPTKSESCLEVATTSSRSGASTKMKPGKLLRT